MKVLNSEIFGAYDALQKLTNLDLPVKTSFQLARLTNLISGHYFAVNQVREKLIKKHGNPVKNTANFSIQPTDEHWPEFVNGLNELMAQEVELEFGKVLLPHTVEGKPLMVKASILVMLEKFVELDI